MGQITRIGMDTSKGFFQLHGVDAGEKAVLRKRLSRGQVLAFFGKLEASKVGMEACGASHYWARELKKLGHEVVLLPPQYVKAYLKRSKNDPADAEALCEAMSRPTMRFVSVKSEESQAGLMLAGLREQLVNRRTQIANTIRGYAAEFGHVAAKGLNHIEELLLGIEEDAQVPELAREMFARLAKEFVAVDREVTALDKKLMTWHRGNALSRRLAEIPGVGPITATQAVMKTSDPKSFRCARNYPAWIGLTPKDHSTAGKQRLGVITRAGDEMLRKSFVAGAMSVVKQAKRKPEKADPWLKGLLARKSAKEAAVALANKNARIVWKMMVTGERYQAGRARPVLASNGERAQPDRNQPALAAEVTL